MFELVVAGHSKIGGFVQIHSLFFPIARVRSQKYAGPFIPSFYLLLFVHIHAARKRSAFFALQRPPLCSSQSPREFLFCRPCARPSLVTRPRWILQHRVKCVDSRNGGDKNLGAFDRDTIKERLFSLYLQTGAFYKSARIAKILNEQQWRLGATGIWKG